MSDTFDPTTYRTMWLELAERVKLHRADTASRALRVDSMEALARLQGFDEALQTCDALMTDVEKRCGVAPRGKPAFEEN